MLKQFIAASATAAVLATGFVTTSATTASAQNVDIRRLYAQLGKLMSCNDQNGQPVLTLFNPMIGRAALLDKTSKGRAIIVVNPKYFSQKTMHIAVFAFYRKCASLALRHPARRTVQHEAQADCWAMQTMLRRRLLNLAETKAILKAVYQFNGQARGNYTLRCAKANQQYIRR